MSRRESVIKAVAGALQAPSLDLTKFLQQSIRERRLAVAPDVAGGALAYAAMDQYQDEKGRPAPHNAPGAQRLRGDPLAPLLLRMKYAGQFSKEPFTRAHLLLLHRYGGVARWPPSAAIFSVAAVALFEWLHDECPKCRKPKPGAPKAVPCLSCGQVRDEETGIVTGQPSAGCLKCKGVGRIFAKGKPPKGMRCLSCNSTGRTTFPMKQRWKLTNEYAATIGKSVSLEMFRSHWSVNYYRFIDVLRAVDRSIVAGLDLSVRPSYDRGIYPESHANVEVDQTEGEAGIASAPDEPAVALGSAFPKIP